MAASEVREAADAIWSSLAHCKWSDIAIILTYLRSSSYGTFDMCQFQFFLVYNLGIKDVGKLATEQGSCVHKALELLGRKKLAIQNGEIRFRDPELDAEFHSLDFTIEDAIETALAHYVPKSIHKYAQKDKDACRQWFRMALTYNDGAFNPLNRTVIEPEKFFDFELEYDWAKYNYLSPFGEKLEGRLALKGTMDMTYRLDEYPSGKIIEMVDWKTGRRWDWAFDKVKDLKALQNDFQLNLYVLALKRTMPEVEQIIVTIMFVKDGGPFTLQPFTNKDILETEQRIRRRFELIKSISRPKQNKTWKCKSFCYFGKNNWEGSDKTICDYMHGELITLGYDKCVAKHGKRETLVAYSEGGGRTHTKEEGKDDGVRNEIHSEG